MYKTIIIGSGPAGWTAAIYAARADMSPVLFAGAEQPGGQLMTTTDVENYPGFPEGVQGPELMEKFRAQAARFGTEFAQGDVIKVDLSKQPFTLSTSDKQFQTKTLIVSTGASAKLLGIPAEKRLMGKGVSACATCDGFFFKGREIAVVGGGDTALEEATFLTKFASKVTVIHRRDKLRASKIMQDKAMKNPKIAWLWDSAVEDILGEGKVEMLMLKNLKTGAKSEFKTQGIFMAIGHQPNTQLFTGQLDMDATGYLKTKGFTSETNVAGVFACGDVQDHRYRQAVTAAGTGCMAALDAERFLEG